MCGVLPADAPALEIRLKDEEAKPVPSTCIWEVTSPTFREAPAVPRINLLDESITTFDLAFKVLAVPEPVITLVSPLLFIVVPDTVSNVGSAQLFARRNLPSLELVP